MSVCSFVCLFVCHKSKPLNSLKSSYCIIHPSSFIILHSFFITLHSSFLHFATFELFSLLSFKLENRCCFAWTSFYLIWKTIFLLFTSYLWKEASKGNTAKFIIFSVFWQASLIHFKSMKTHDHTVWQFEKIQNSWMFYSKD